MGTKLKLHPAANHKASDALSALPIEADERHQVDIDAYIVRNRDALNASIAQSRAELADGTVSTRSVDDIIASGRRRYGQSN
jgi:hypothetical protein